MREIFERVEDSTTIKIEAEVDIEEHIEDYPWLYSLFVKPNNIEENSLDFERFLEFKESVIISLEHNNVAKYVGERASEGWYELYFYAKDSKNLEASVLKTLRESGYKYESNVVKDAKWDFYEKNIFPTELEFHDIQSSKIIFLLQEEGDELTVPRDVEHYASFDTATQKERFLKNATAHGFEFKDDISSEEFEHGVALLKKHPVTEKEVRKVVEELYGLIKKEHGYYEGWSTTLATKDD